MVPDRDREGKGIRGRWWRHNCALPPIWKGACLQRRVWQELMWQERVAALPPAEGVCKGQVVEKAGDRQQEAAVVARPACPVVPGRALPPRQARRRPQALLPACSSWLFLQWQAGPPTSGAVRSRGMKGAEARCAQARACYSIPKHVMRRCVRLRQKGRGRREPEKKYEELAVKRDRCVQRQQQATYGNPSASCRARVSATNTLLNSR